MRITLLRHGQPAFALSGRVRAEDLRKYAKLYASSGIVGKPPRTTVDAVQGHNIVVCSDLPRSLESAKALGLARIYSEDSLFGEIAIPHFSGGSITLPVGVWVVVLRSLWLLGFSRNGESLSNARRRARQATERLTQWATEYEKVLLVGHGLMNYLIAKELLADGWVGPSNPGRGFWEYGVYRSVDTQHL
jgi:broad specificity phosphatase PhoE